MPSKPKIPKSEILKAALEILIADGYQSLNIKAVASRLKCSTQPISWQFGNMEGMRRELTEYALSYVNAKMAPRSQNPFTAYTEVGSAYVDIAYDEPELFKYVFLNAAGGFSVGGLDGFVSSAEDEELKTGIAEQFSISKESASAYLINNVVYSTGLLSFIVSGVLKCDRDEVKRLIDNAGNAFLVQAGVSSDDIKKLKNRLIGD